MVVEFSKYLAKKFSQVKAHFICNSFQSGYVLASNNFWQEEL